MRNKGFTLIELMLVVMIIGLLAAMGIPNFVRLTTNAKEASVKENSHTVQMAAEDFAVQKDGIYASDVTDASSLSGNSIIDMLPSGTNLSNPFTQALTEPVDGAAANPGETGYEPVVDGSGTVEGYIITGFGRNRIVTRLTSGS
jgi:prepilin-type N-terminal cleavage/methylation domain-containing protein